MEEYNKRRCCRTRPGNSKNDDILETSRNISDDGVTSNYKESEIFLNAFAPLAHHVYPDGCPAFALLDVWPSRKTRVIVPPKDAVESIRSIRAYALKYGLSSKQSSAIAFVAGSIVKNRRSFADFGSQINNCNYVAVVGGRVPLDGISQHFCLIVRSLLPRNLIYDLPQDYIIIRLLSAASASDVASKCCVLQFLTLAFLWQISVSSTSSQNRNDLVAPCKHPKSRFPQQTDNITSEPSGNKISDMRPCIFDNKTFISLVYKIIFPWALQLATCVDSIRLLLLLLTKFRDAEVTQSFVTTQRAAKLSAFYVSCCQKKDLLAEEDTLEKNKVDRDRSRISKEIDMAIVVIPSILHMFASSNQSCKKYYNFNELPLPSTIQELLQFPDAAWKSQFWQESHDEEDTKSIKRSRYDRVVTEIDVILESIASRGDAIEGFKSDFFATKRRYTDILTNFQIRHSWLLSEDDQANSLPCQLQDSLHYALTDELRHRDRADLYKYNGVNAFAFRGSTSKDPSTTTNSLISHRNKVIRSTEHQMKIVESLEDFSLHTDHLPPVSEDFVINSILPMWDSATSISRNSVLFCEILPYLRPRSFGMLCLSGILSQTHRLFVYGHPRLKYAIVSGFISLLICRWGRLDWSKIDIAGGADNNQLKLKTLFELIQWSDALLLKGILISENYGGREILWQASVDYLKALDRLSEICEIRYFSSSLNFISSYLLLSPSFAQLDQICLLLSKLKVSEWKSPPNKSSCPSEIKNPTECLIRNFYSLLWISDHSYKIMNEKECGNKLFKGLSILDIGKQPRIRLSMNEAKFHALHSLSITQGAVFAGYVKKFFQQIQTPDFSQRSPSTIQDSLKAEYLAFLKSHGLNGIHSLLSSFQIC